MMDKRLFSLVPGCGWRVALVVLLKWLALVANVLTMTIIGVWLRDVVERGPSMPGPLTLALFAVTLGLRMLATYGSARASDTLSRRARTTIRERVYGKLLALGPSFAEEVSTAEAVQTSMEGAQQLEVYYGAYLPQLFYSLLAPLTVFALLVRIAGRAPVVLLLLVPLIPVSIVFVQKPARAAAKAYWSSYVDLGGDFLEAVQGLTTLKVYQADGRWHERMNREAEGFRQATMKMLSVQLRSIVVMDVFAYCGAAVGIVIALQQYAHGAIGFLGCFLMVFLSQEFFLPMRQLGSLFHTAMGGLASARRMYQILDAEAPAQGTTEVPATAGPEVAPVELHGVGYTYADRTVVADVDLALRAGRLVALVGESGSGKSTVAGIIAGRKLAYTGSARVCGVEAREADPASLMRAVTLVGTNAHLFAGTVRSNLLLAKPDATDDELWGALSSARAAGFVRQLGGLDAPVGEGGANLSGGQRQRIALARALARDSQAYVFDEAMSSVDTTSEAAIARTVSELARRRAVLVVAHRLELVRDAAEIVVMDQGRVAERGTHDDLLAADGIYARLWRQQTEFAAFVDHGADAADDEVVVVPAAEVTSAAASTSDGRASAPSTVSVLRRMLALVRPLAGHLCVATLLGCIGHLAAIAIPVLGAYGLVAAAGRPLAIGLGAACVGAIVCGVVRGPARYGEQLCNHYVAFRLLAHVRDLIFAALRRLAPAKLEGRGKGDVVSLATSDVELLEVFYAHTISPVAIALVVCAGMLLFLGAHDGSLALAGAVGYLLVGLVIPWVGDRLTRGSGAKVRTTVGATNALVLESLRGLGETIQYGRTGDALRALDAAHTRLTATELPLRRTDALLLALGDGAVLVAGAALLSRAVGTIGHGGLSVPAAIVCGLAYLSSFGPAFAVARLGTSLQQTVGAGQRVLDLLDERPQTEDVTNGVDVAFTGAALERVSFSYDRLPVLRDVTMGFAPGTITCVSGPSGCGKSTVLKLLMRFWDADAGSLSLSGHDIRQVNTASLRANEAFMAQETHLFRGTIAENVLLARPDATRGELEAAISAAALDELAARLEQGLDTQVGELGERLSGGERQRIGLARAFLADAPFVLLDEPTSNLDALNEAQVMRAVAEHRGDKTIVVVTHRASTAAFADRFVRLGMPAGGASGSQTDGS